MSHADLCESSPAQQSAMQASSSYQSCPPAIVCAAMYCFVYVRRANRRDPDAISLAFIRTELPMYLFATIVMQLTEGISVHMAGSDRIGWWHGFAT